MILAVWLLVVPRLAEPANAVEKIPYRGLATVRIGAIVAVLGAAATWLSWSALPIELRPPWLILSTLGVALAAIDGYTTWMPASVTRWTWAVMGLAGLAMLPLGGDWTDVLRLCVGAVGAGSLYALLWIVTRGGFGFGDVRFVPVVAAPAAAAGWTTLMLTLVLGSLLTLADGIVRRLRGRDGYMPWAPAMIVGAYLAVLLTQ